MAIAVETEFDRKPPHDIACGLEFGGKTMGAAAKRTIIGCALLVAAVLDRSFAQSAELAADVGSTVTLTGTYYACQDWNKYKELFAILDSDEAQFKYLWSQEMETGACDIFEAGTPVVVTAQELQSVQWRRKNDSQLRPYWTAK
jgi:hypothetical protein